MREIKFRAWDEKEKCWVVGFAIHQNGMFSDWAGCKEVNGKCYADANWEQLKNIPHIKIMQYTGLKDKNGREIYEGDIVKHAIWGDVYEVIFEDGGFYVLSSYDFQTINEYPLEVIGNIFQDGDLLRDS